MFSTIIVSIILLGLAHAQDDLPATTSRENNTRTASNNTRIVGGQVADSISDFPYQVSLQQGNRHFCGATIIDDTNLLTAGHCVVSEGVVTAAANIKAVVGDLSTSGTSSTSIKRTIRRIYVHENYYEAGGVPYNDVAVLKIDSLGNFTEYVNNISLSTVSPAENSNCVVSGWGTTSSGGTVVSTLRYVNVPIVAKEICQYSYPTGTVNDGSICAGNYTHGQIDACQGDSGGPLACDGDLVGVVSWGQNCALPGYPGVYANVATYRTWIEEQLEKDSSYVLINNLYLIMFSAILSILLK